MAKNKRKLRTYTYKGYELEQLCEMKENQLIEIFPSRVRRKLKRSQGLKGKYLKLVEKVKKAKANTPAGEKPQAVKTHLRNAIIMPEMVGGSIACYNGKDFQEFEVRFDMIGKYCGEFAITYTPTLRKAAWAREKKPAE